MSRGFKAFLINRKRAVAATSAIVIGLSVVAFGMASGSPFSSSPARRHPIPKWAMDVSLPTPAQLAMIRTRLIKETSDEGESHPTHGLVVATRRQEFVRAAFGSGENFGDEDVFVVSAEGNFTDYSASRPAGADPPKGHFVMAVLDAKTLELLDYSLRPSPVDTTKYGPAYTLDLSS